MNDADPSPFVNRWRRPILTVLFFVLAGNFLEWAIGEVFVFSGTNAYRAAWPLLLTILLPLFAIMLYPAVRSERHFSRYPTRWVRWLALYPCMVMICAALIIISPLGWAALLGRMSGTTTDLEATVLSVEQSPGSRYCHLRAELSISGTTASICLDDRVTGKTPAAGNTLLVVGRVSRWGVLIEQVRVK